MKNSFTLEVSFSLVPLNPYEWDNITVISGISVLRIKQKALKDILTYDAIINSDKKTLLLSDGKCSIVVRLDSDGHVLKRSFLTFEKDAEVCEFACNMKSYDLEYTVTNTKLKYPDKLQEDKMIKEYLLKSIKQTKDEDKSKYLYYLYFNSVDDYNKEKLLTSIKEDECGNYQKLYDFLMQK